MCTAQTRGTFKDWDVVAALAVQNHRQGRDAEDKKEEDTVDLVLYRRLARCGLWSQLQSQKCDFFFID